MPINHAFIAREMINRSGGNPSEARRILREIAPSRRMTFQDLGRIDELLIQAETNSLMPFQLERLAARQQILNEQGDPEVFGGNILKPGYDNKFHDPVHGYLYNRTPGSEYVGALGETAAVKGAVVSGYGDDIQLGALGMSGLKSKEPADIVKAWGKRLNLGGGQEGYMSLNDASGNALPRRENVFDQDSGLIGPDGQPVRTHRNSGVLMRTMFVAGAPIVRDAQGRIDYKATHPDAFIPGGFGLIQAGTTQTLEVPRYLTGVTRDQIKTGRVTRDETAHFRMAMGDDLWAHLKDYQAIDLEVDEQGSDAHGTMVRFRLHQGAAGHGRSQMDLKAYTGAEADLANANAPILGVSPEALRKHKIQYLTSIDSLKTIGGIQELVNEQVYRYGGPERYLTMMLGAENAKQFINERGGINWRKISTTPANRLGLVVDGRLQQATGNSASVFQHIAFQAALSPGGSGFQYTEDRTGLISEYAHGVARAGAYEGSGKPRVSGENLARIMALDPGLASQIYAASESRVQHYGELYRSVMSNVPETTDSFKGVVDAKSYGVNQEAGGTNVINLSEHPEFAAEIRKRAAKIAQDDGGRATVTRMDMLAAMRQSVKDGWVAGLKFNTHTVLKARTEIVAGTWFDVSLPSLRNLDYFAGPSWRDDRPDASLPQNAGANTFGDTEFERMVSAYSINGFQIMAAAIMGDDKIQGAWARRMIGAAAGMAAGRETLTNALSFTAPRAYEGNYTVSTDIEPGVVVFSREAIRKAFPEIGNDEKKLDGICRSLSGLNADTPVLEAFGWRSPGGDISSRTMLGGLRIMVQTPGMRWSAPHGIMLHPDTVSTYIGDVDGDRALMMIKNKIVGWGGPDGNTPIFNVDDYSPKAAEMRAKYDYMASRNLLGKDERKKVIDDLEKIWKSNPQDAFRQTGGDLREIMLDYISHMPTGTKGMLTGSETQEAMGFYHESKTKTMTQTFNIARAGRAMEGDDDFGMVIFPGYQTGIDVQALDPGMHAFVRYMTHYDPDTGTLQPMMATDKRETVKGGNVVAMARALGGLVWSYAQSPDVSEDGDAVQAGEDGLRLKRMNFLLQKLVGKDRATDTLARRLIKSVVEEKNGIDAIGLMVAEELRGVLLDKGVTKGDIWSNANELGGVPRLFRLMAIGRGSMRDDPAMVRDQAELELAQGLRASVSMSSRRIDTGFSEERGDYENAANVASGISSTIRRAYAAGEYGKVIEWQRRNVMGMTVDPGLPSQATPRRRKMAAPGERVARVSYRGMKAMEAAKRIDLDRLMGWVDENWNNLSSVFGGNSGVPAGERPYGEDPQYQAGEGGGIFRMASATDSELFLGDLLDDPSVPETIKRGLERALGSERITPRPTFTFGSAAPVSDPALPSMSRTVSGSQIDKGKFDLARDALLTMLREAGVKVNMSGGSASRQESSVFGTAMHQLMEMMVSGSLGGISGADYGWLGKYDTPITEHVLGEQTVKDPRGDITTTGRLDFVFPEKGGGPRHLRDLKFMLRDPRLKDRVVPVSELQEMEKDPGLSADDRREVKRALGILEKAHPGQLQFYAHMYGLTQDDTGAFVFMPADSATENLHSLFAASGARPVGSTSAINPVTRAILQAANDFSRQARPRLPDGMSPGSSEAIAVMDQARVFASDPKNFVNVLNAGLKPLGHEIGDISELSALINAQAPELASSLSEMLGFLSPEAKAPNVQLIDNLAIGDAEFSSKVRQTAANKDDAGKIAKRLFSMLTNGWSAAVPDGMEPGAADIFSRLLSTEQGVEGPGLGDVSAAIKALTNDTTAAQEKFGQDSTYRGAAAFASKSAGARFKSTGSYVEFMSQLLTGQSIDRNRVFRTGTASAWYDPKIGDFITRHNTLLAGGMRGDQAENYRGLLQEVVGHSLTTDQHQELLAQRGKGNKRVDALLAEMYPEDGSSGVANILQQLDKASTFAGKHQPLMRASGEGGAAVPFEMIPDPNAPPPSSGRRRSMPLKLEQIAGGEGDAFGARAAFTKLDSLYEKISSEKQKLESLPDFNYNQEAQEQYAKLHTLEKKVHSAQWSVAVGDPEEGDQLGARKIAQKVDNANETFAEAQGKFTQYSRGVWGKARGSPIANARGEAVRMLLSGGYYQEERERYVSSGIAKLKEGANRDIDDQNRKADDAVDEWYKGEGERVDRLYQDAQKKARAHYRPANSSPLIETSATHFVDSRSGKIVTSDEMQRQVDEEALGAVQGAAMAASSELDKRKAANASNAYALRVETSAKIDRDGPAALRQDFDSRVIGAARVGKYDEAGLAGSLVNLEKAFERSTKFIHENTDAFGRAKAGLEKFGEATEAAKKAAQGAVELRQQAKDKALTDAERLNLEERAKKLDNLSAAYGKQADWHESLDKTAGGRLIKRLGLEDAFMPDDLKTDDQKQANKSGVRQVMSGFGMFYMNRMFGTFINPAIEGAVAGAREDSMLRSTFAGAGLGIGTPGGSARALTAIRDFEVTRNRQQALTWSSAIGDNAGGLGGLSAAGSILGPAAGAGFLSSYMLGELGTLAGGAGTALGAGLGALALPAGILIAGTTAAIGGMSRGAGIARNPVMAGTDAARNEAASPFGGWVQRGVDDFSLAISGSKLSASDLTREGAARLRGFESTGWNAASYRGAARNEALRDLVWGHEAAKNVGAGNSWFENIGLLGMNYVNQSFGGVTSNFGVGITKPAAGIDLAGRTGIAELYGVDDQTALQIAGSALRYSHTNGQMDISGWAKAVMSGSNVQGVGQVLADLGGGGITSGIQAALGIYADSPQRADEFLAGAKNGAAQLAFSTGRNTVTRNVPTPSDKYQVTQTVFNTTGEGYAKATEALQKEDAQTQAQVSAAGSRMAGIRDVFLSRGRGVPADLQAKINEANLLFEQKDWAGYTQKVTEAANQWQGKASVISTVANAWDARVGFEQASAMGFSMQQAGASEFQAAYAASAAQGDPIVLSNLGMNNPGMSVGGLSGADLVTMQNNGLPMFTTSMSLGGMNGGYQGDPRMLEPVWDKRVAPMMGALKTSSPGLYGALAGTYKPLNADRLGLNTQGGIWGLQQYMSDQSYLNQMASIGNSAASAQLGWAFTSGEGLGKYGNFMSQWDLTRANRDLERSQTTWVWGQQERGRDMQIRQFYETQDFSRRQVDLGYAREQQDFGLQRQQMGMQRQWQQQDFGYNRQMFNLQFGWSMTDMDENIRYATGRERRIMERHRGQAVVSHDLEGEQMSRQETRARQSWKLEDERFAISRKRSEENHKLSLERMELEKKHFLERMALDKEGFEKQKEFTRENWKLQEEAFDAQRAQQTEAHKLQMAGIGLQMSAAKLNKDNQDIMTKISQEQDIANGKLRWAMGTSEQFFVDLGDYLIKLQNAMKHGDAAPGWPDHAKRTDSPMSEAKAAGFHGMLTPREQRRMTVNEQGPEWVDVYPFGARPPRLSEVARGSSGGSSAAPVNITVILDGKEIGYKLADGVAQQIYTGRRR